jgi:hypothetical protein
LEEDEGKSDEKNQGWRPKFGEKGWMDAMRSAENQQEIPRVKGTNNKNFWEFSHHLHSHPIFRLISSVPPSFIFFPFFRESPPM